MRGDKGSATIEGFAAWHPLHGFQIPFYEGPLVHADLSGLLTREIINLNREDGTTNRNGWRAVRVVVSRAAP